MWTLFLLFLGLAWPQEPDMSADDPFAPTYGDAVDREGWWVVDPVVGGKALQAVSLLFDDGESWIVHYRVRPGDLQWADKRVRVRGRPYWPSSQVQHVMATHLSVDAIELAAGETPWDPVPTEVPAPPIVREVAALQARGGRWVQAVGLLAHVDPSSERWTEGRLTLTGGQVALTGILTRQVQGLEPGAPITVLGKVSSGEGGPRLGVRAVCTGEDRGCGMSGIP